MDFSQLKVSTKVNSKKETITKSVKGTTKNKPIISSIRSTEENLPKPKLIKNFDISMYKQVFQSCDKCNNSTVHYMKGLTLICMYCNNIHNINEYKGSEVVIAQTKNFINDFIWF